jgi:glycosyltransferase involved in cell wall biosynthesis
MFHALWSGHRYFLILGTSGACVLPLVRLFFPNIKIVTNIDGLEWQRQKWGSLTRRFLKVSERLAVRFSSIVVADNQAIARYVEVTYKRSCETIAYGGDHAVIDAMIVLGTGPATDRDPYAFALCRIEPENNAHMILEAFATAELSLIFVGNWQASDYGKDLQQRYSKVPSIELIEPIYDLQALAFYRSNCEVYVHGHSAGGTNPSLVEMMHFDKPIVAFDCVYNRATLEGIGHYFSSVSTLSRIVEEDFLYNDGVKFGDIARRRYTWSIVRKQYRDLFHSD